MQDEELISIETQEKSFFLSSSMHHSFSAVFANMHTSATGLLHRKAAFRSARLLCLHNRPAIVKQTKNCFQHIEIALEKIFSSAKCGARDKFFWLEIGKYFSLYNPRAIVMVNMVEACDTA
jgi:hypothetical protein